MKGSNKTGSEWYFGKAQLKEKKKKNQISGLGGEGRGHCEGAPGNLGVMEILYILIVVVYNCTHLSELKRPTPFKRVTSIEYNLTKT